MSSAARIAATAGSPTTLAATSLPQVPGRGGEGLARPDASYKSGYPVRVRTDPIADRRLVSRMLAGEAEAFESFFDQCFPGLYRFALSRVRQDPAAAEEVAQATLCKAVAKLSTFRGEAALFTWLCTFCRHEISAYFGRQGRSSPEVALIEDSPEIQAALDALARQGENPETLLRRRELSHLVRVTLDQLPSRYGDALEWKYVEGLSVVEIAQRLGVGPKAAESVLTRARDAFRRGFAELCGGVLSQAEDFSS